jgi:hypothetical protein
MMEAVADQRQDDERAADTEGTELEPAPPSDPEDLRRFREFQQFQEFQRFQEYQRAQQAAGSPGELEPAGSREVVPTPQPEPKPKRRPPSWMGTVVGKVLSALLVLAAVVIGVGLAIDYFLGDPDPVTPQEQAKHNRDVPIEEEGPHWASDPYEAVRRVYHDIAQGDVEYACLRFAGKSREQFAENMRYPSCEEAVRAISAEVRAGNGANSYAESIPSSTPGERYAELSKVEPGETLTVDSCEAATGDGIQGGPVLGTFVVTRLPEAYGVQWTVTEHRAQPRKCRFSAP